MSRAVLVMMFLACPLAHADWQYTKWGMTMPQLEAAAAKAGASLQRTEGAEDRAKGFRYQGTYKAGPHSFETTFLVDENERLRKVQLRLLSESRLDCVKLGADLKAAYGKPEESDSAGAEWTDRKKGNRVSWADVGLGLCVVAYRPSAPAKNGL